MTPDEDNKKEIPKKTYREDDGDPCWTRPLVSVKSQDRKDI